VLQIEGYAVLRFTARQIEDDARGVAAQIAQLLRRR
jgi:very-short-patch-repair endonuclease